ncbi:MAG TPA: carbohydrate kinase [Anaerolineae bacterium]|nr:carbohydrate kinase [Anaerolineae bacterium]
MAQKFFDVVCLGELLMDLFPAEIGRRLADVSAFAPKAGGGAANTVVAAARLGAATAFIGKVGEDFFGHSLAETLEREGVDTRGMRFDPDVRTTLAFIALPTPNTPEFIFYRNPGADQRLRVEELDRELLQNTRALMMNSIPLSDEPCRSAAFEAVRRAREAGARFMFDMNYRGTMWRSDAEAMEQIERMLPQVDVFKANESELALLAGSSDFETGSAQLLAKGPKLVVITHGARGSYFRSAAASGLVPSFQVQVVDAVGSGDAFMGALIVQLVRRGMENLDMELKSVLQYANAAGAITATRQGGIPALPTAAAVEEFLKSRL